MKPFGKRKGLVFLLALAASLYKRLVLRQGAHDVFEGMTANAVLRKTLMNERAVYALPRSWVFTTPSP